ncbi:MAG: YcjF family protein [Acidobacteriota bacterium]
MRKEAARPVEGAPGEPKPETPAGSKATASREAQAQPIINKYMIGSLVAGIIPVPIVDIAAVTGIQLKMLHSLSRLYELEFRENAGKFVIGSLVGGIGSSALAWGMFGSLVKAIPIIGPLASRMTMPVLAGASTYALGKVFVQHFEMGGTFLNFDPSAVREHYEKLFKEGQQVASEMAKEASA